MYIHVSKKRINISLHLNRNVLRKLIILCWVTLIAVHRMLPAGHGLDSPVRGETCYKGKNENLKNEK